MLETPNSWETGSTAEEYTDEPQDATRVPKPRTAAVCILNETDRDFALAGSPPPVSSTI
jgi:hypothetical protein